MSNSFAIPWTEAHQVPLSMGFSRQEYWSGSPFPSPEDLPDPGIEHGSPTLQADSLPSEPPGKPLRTFQPRSEEHTSELQFSALWADSVSGSSGSWQI